MKKNIVIVVIILGLLSASGGSFYGGILYGKSQNTPPSFTGGNLQNMNVGGNRANTNGTNLISGQIIYKDNNSVTVQQQDSGSSRIIFFSDTTQISKYDAGTADDLTTGTSVSVMGTTNSDGSVSAQTIQIRPANQNFRPNQPASGQ